MVLLLLYVFIAVALIQFIFYIGIFPSVFLAKKELVKTVAPPVSVIICAKNEEENLQKNLQHILDQEYPNFQVVLINDASTDDTLEVMESFSHKHKNIKIVNVKNNEHFWGKKKYALTLGIKAAAHEHLVFTDADCHPVSKNWLANMAASFSRDVSIVLGYGGYKKTNHSFLNALIRFETLFTAMQYLSFALKGMPYMGVGRNLAYTKTEFFNNNGFMSHMQIRSGDDDLFVNEAATSKNTGLCINKDAFTLSEGKKTFKDWFLQKRRHISTAKYYKPKHQLILILFYVSQVLFWGLALTFLILPEYRLYAAILLTLRLAASTTVTAFVAKKFNEKLLIPLLPFYEVCLISVQFGIFISSIFSKPSRWK